MNKNKTIHRIQLEYADRTVCYPVSKGSIWHNACDTLCLEIESELGEINFDSEDGVLGAPSVSAALDYEIKTPVDSLSGEKVYIPTSYSEKYEDHVTAFYLSEHLELDDLRLSFGKFEQGFIPLEFSGFVPDNPTGTPQSKGIKVSGTALLKLISGFEESDSSEDQDAPLVLKMLKDNWRFECSPFIDTQNAVSFKDENEAIEYLKRLDIDRYRNLKFIDGASSSDSKIRTFWMRFYPQAGFQSTHDLHIAASIAGWVDDYETYPKKTSEENPNAIQFNMKKNAEGVDHYIRISCVKDESELLLQGASPR